jgi:tRNA(adenine34) deaminase
MSAAEHPMMHRALELAQLATQHDDVPVGCVVVVDGRIVGEGENRRELDRDPTAHAEVVALRRAASEVGTWRLENATVYVTLEPCTMCAGALLNARVGRVVFGAYDEKAGACGSRYNVLNDPRLLHEAEVRGGVCAEESAALLQEFFSTRR